MSTIARSAARALPDWLPQAEWPFASRVVDVGGRAIHVVDEGSGPTLLFVHAGLWSFVWRDLIVELRRDFRCVTLDFPGSGLSPLAGEARPSLGLCVEVLEGLIDQLALADVTLVLHDLGGPVGLVAAARQPDRVRALCALQTFGWKPRAGLRAALRVVGSTPLRWSMTKTNLLMRATSSQLGVGRRLGRAGRRAFLGPMMLPGPRAAFHHLMRDAARPAAIFDEVDAGLAGPLADRPLLGVFARVNDATGYFRRGWRRRQPNARIVTLRRGLHFPMCDDPATVAAVIREWHATT